MRSFAVILIIVSALIMPLWLQSSLAQAKPVGIVTDTPNEVFRRYLAETANVGPVFDGQSMSLYSYGFVATSTSEAKREFKAIARQFPEVFEMMADETERESGVTIELAEHRRVEFAQLGDEAAAFVTPAMYGVIGVEFAVAIIRDASWLQMLLTVAFNDNGETIELLEDVASTAKTRWPNDTSVRVRTDGVRYGGVWGLAVLPDEVPDHLRLDTGYDEGPGPGALPPSSKPTPMPTIASSTESPESTAEPAQASSQDSRLAQPFDTTIRVILANDTFSADSRGQCEGQGRYSSLHEEGLAALKTVDGGEELVLTRGLQPGYVSYDLQLQADVCVFEINFRKVPPRAGYLLIAGDAPIARFTYDELSAGGIGEVVVEN